MISPFEKETGRGEELVSGLGTSEESDEEEQQRGQGVSPMEVADPKVVIRIPYFK